MRIPDPKANTTTEAYLAYKAGYLEQSELKPVLYEPYLHFDGWLAYWAGLTTDYPHGTGKNLAPSLSGYAFSRNGSATTYSVSGNSLTVTTERRGSGVFMSRNNATNIAKCPYLFQNGYVVSMTISATTSGILRMGPDTVVSRMDVNVGSEPVRVSFPAVPNVNIIFYQQSEGTLEYTISDIQCERGSTATDYEPYTVIPEMLTDEEALVAYLAGVTDTYPEDIKDPYDVRIVGYLRHLASIRWPEPDYPVNNEEFYLSTMEPTHTSNPEPSADIELDTVDGNIISVEAYGDTYQQTYSGKNLLYIPTGTSASNGITWTRNGNTVSGTGTGTGSYSATSGWLSYTLPAGTYTFSIGEAVTKRVQFARRVDSSSPAQTVNLPAGDTSITFTNSEATSEYHVVLLDTSGESVSNFTIKDMQLEVGSEASSFEPYVGGIPAPNPDYPQDVHTVTGEQTVRIGGKNLWKPAPDGTNIQGGITSVSENGVITLTGTSTSTSTGTSAFYDLDAPLPAGTYTYSVKNALPYRLEFVMQDSSGTNHFPRIEANSKSGTITTTWETVKIRNGIGGFSVGTEINLTIEELQLEVGSTPTPYEPYQSQSYTVDLGTTELCKIGDYQDYIYKSGDDWYVHKDIGKSELGSLTWGHTGTNQTGIYRKSSDDLKLLMNSSANNKVFSGVCTHFVATRADSAGTYGANQGVSVNVSGILLIYDDVYNTSSDDTAFKTWLQDNNVVLYYTLITPTDTKITDATLVGQLEALANADTYNEKTYIKVTANDPNLPALLKVEAYKY